MLGILLSIALVVCVFSLIITFVIMKKQQNKELDKSMNLTTAKHPFIANPIIIAYVLFPIVLILGGILWMYYS
ncbi:hypothetical protein WMW72_12855 [Paenibacillus filicis]|uniref:Short-chain dehydrogenase n=1 Tax=Paenibacillus filicis TaxID=669464 RepID=A0ABU9DIV1_9BACL